jgi:hypothetical protein
MFARSLHRIAATGQGMQRFSNSYLGRVVGGAEEAALRFLIDLQRIFPPQFGERRTISGSYLNSCAIM